MRYPVVRARQLTAALYLLVLPLVAGAQQKHKLRPEDPYTARSVTVMAVSTLTDGQRAIVYVRPNEFPGLLVLIHQGTGTAEDLAAGYETARRMIDPQVGLKVKMAKREGSQARVVVDATQVRSLRGPEQAAFAGYLEHLRHAPEFTIDGIGTGPLLRIARRK